MLTISSIPQEIYYVALQYEGWDLPEHVKDSSHWYFCEVENCMETTGGLEKALSDYFLRKGLFREGAAFEDCKGFSTRI